MLRVNVQETGLNIKRIMKQNNLGVIDLQEACGCSTNQSVYKWFQGKNLPTVDNLVILAGLFNCPIDNILCIDEFI